MAYERQICDILLSQPDLVICSPVNEFLPCPVKIVLLGWVPVEVSQLHGKALIDLGNVAVIVCMVNPDGATAMYSSPPPGLNQLYYGVSESKVIEMVIEHCRLQDANTIDSGTREWLDKIYVI